MIIFLTGSACAGKSRVRRDIWPDAKYVDIYDWQVKMYNSGLPMLQSALKAEEEAINEFMGLIDSKKPGEVVIFESPLSNSDRRKKYASLAREHGPDEEIICLVVEPDEADIPYLVSKRVEKTDPEADPKLRARDRKSVV